MELVKQKRDRPVAKSTILSRQEKDALDAEVRRALYKKMSDVHDWSLWTEMY